MKRTKTIVIALILIMLAASLSTSAFALPRTDPGSFLVYKADSVDSFVTQLTSNKRVAARYARHYGISPDKLGKYFSENICIKTLDKPYRTTVYFISKGNVIKQKQRVLKAGSKVFVGPNGLPLLEWRCGNPLGTQLPPAPKPLAKASPAPDWAVAPAPVLEVAAAAAEALPQAVPITAAPALAVQDALVPAAGGLSFSEPLLLLGGAIPMLIGGVAVNNHSSTPSVPEPASIVTLLVGASGIILRARRKK
ncbi:PEP-CTERM sorting domain-containing protein [bacterium]|nr:PEP-CTERM sorting domain-containing protein [bacterium]